MITTIDTKFQIGDEVWIYDYFYDKYYPCKYPCKISEINVKITGDKTIIAYLLIVNHGEYQECQKHSSENFFSSYEECAKWCKKHNNI